MEGMKTGVELQERLGRRRSGGYASFEDLCGRRQRMPQFREMDEKTAFSAQIEQEVGPVVLMKQQPGFISAQLHRGIAGSRLFMNYAVWKTVADLRRALNHPDFQANVKIYPAGGVASPHLFQQIAVSHVCVGQRLERSPAPLH